MAKDIVHEATYDLPPEAVWKAIATKPGLDAWMMRNDFAEAKVGHRFTFTDKPRPFWDGQCPCEVLEADEPHRFVLKWNTNDPSPSTVSWTLTPTASGGTHVVFRHAGLTGYIHRTALRAGAMASSQIAGDVAGDHVTGFYALGECVAGLA